MAALGHQYMSSLKRILSERFVRHLPRPIDENESQEKMLSKAFGAFVLSKIATLSEKDAAESVVDGANDKGIDVIFYDENTEALFLIQGKLKESEQFRQNDALAFLDGVRRIIRHDFAGFNDLVTSRKSYIEDALESCSKITLVVAYTGDGVSESAGQALKKGVVSEIEYEERLEERVLFYTPSDIKNSLLEEQAYPSVNVDIDLRNPAGISEPKVTYFGIMRLGDLVLLHKKYGKALYERNIRYYLGSSRYGVNSAIKSTLAECPEDFFYLNNGVTAVCDQVDPKSHRGGVKRFKVKGLSIINGAQTVASAAEFVEQNSSVEIDSAQVMFTLIKAPSDGVFGKRVTKARNHQNQVQGANFSSLDDNQERLRKEIALLGYMYQCRPEVSLAGGKTISLNEAVRALASCQRDPRFAAWLKSEPARLSTPESSEYRILFSDSLTGLFLVNAVLCFREVRGLVYEYEIGAEHDRSQDKLIYRHSAYAIVAVMMKRLCRIIKGREVVNPECVRSIISHPLDVIRQQTVDLAHVVFRNKGALAYFRNQSDVAEFVARLMEVNFQLGGDSGLVALRGVSDSSEAYPKQRLINYLSGKAPQL